jgi:hypothetical protein
MATSGFDRNSLGNAAASIAENAAIANGAAYLTTRQNSKYMSGARTVLKINGRLYGFAFQVSWTVNTEVTEIRTIDDVLPVEIGPKFISISGTIGALMVPGQSVEAEILQSNMLSFIFDKYITIEVSDSATGNLLFRTNKAFISSSQHNINAEQLGNCTLQFRAMDWFNEKVPDYPSGGAIDPTSFNPGEAPAFPKV